MFTQKQIAAELKVSRSTVAAALNPNTPIKLAASTRRRVLEVARRRGYRSPHQRRVRPSGLIGVIHQEGPLEVSQQRTKMLAQSIRATGRHPLLMGFTGYPSESQTMCQVMIDARVEGVVLQSTQLTLSQIHQFHEQNIPVVALCGDKLPNVPLIRADVRQGMRDLTSRLIAAKRRDLKMILVCHHPTIPLFNQPWPASERARGFQEALHAAGLDCVEHEQIIILPAPTDSYGWMETGSMAMRSMLDRRVSADGLVFSNDHLAIGAIHAARLRGLRIPQDVAITGFDDTLMGVFASVALTTVRQPNEKMVDAAMRWLLERIDGSPDPSLHGEAICFPCELVIRESCGARVQAASSLHGTPNTGASGAKHQQEN